MAEFAVTERTIGTTVVLELTGRLDGSATAEMTRLHAVLDRPVNAVVMDLAAVEYINSTGLALVVGLAAKARAADVELQACGLSDHYVHIFQITRIADFMRIFPDQATALAPPAGSVPT